MTEISAPPDGLPEVVYHGFDYRRADAIKVEGLKPTAMTGVPSQWREFPSSKDMVYLTNAWGLYFSASASGAQSLKEDITLAIAEIDTSQLDPALLRPDEDWLAYKDDKGGDQVFTAEMRDRIDEFQAKYKQCFVDIGTVAYKGCIAPGAMKFFVKKFSEFTPEEAHVVSVVRHLKPPCPFTHVTHGRGLIEVTRGLFGRRPLPTVEELKNLGMPYFGH